MIAERTRPRTTLALAALGLGLGLAGLTLNRAPLAAIARFRWTPGDFVELVLLVGAAQLVGLLALVHDGARARGPRRGLLGLSLLPAIAAIAAAIVHHLRARTEVQGMDLGPLGRLIHPQIDIGAMRLLVALGLGASAQLAAIAALTRPPDAPPERPPSASAITLISSLSAALGVALLLASRLLGTVELSPYDLLVLLTFVVEAALLIRALGGAFAQTSLPAATLAVAFASLAAVEHHRGVAMLTGLDTSESGAALEQAAQGLRLRPLLAALDSGLALGLAALALRRRRRVTGGATLRAALPTAPWAGLVLALVVGLEIIAAREIAAPLAFYDRFVGIDLPAVGAPVDRPLGDIPALRALFLRPDGGLRVDDSDGLAPAEDLDTSRLRAPPRSAFIAQSDEKARLLAAAQRRMPLRRYLVAVDRRAPYATLASSLDALRDAGLEIELGLLVAAVARPDESGAGSRALVSTRFRDRTLIRFFTLSSIDAAPRCERRAARGGARRRSSRRVVSIPCSSSPSPGRCISPSPARASSSSRAATIRRPASSAPARSRCSLTSSTSARWCSPRAPTTAWPSSCSPSISSGPSSAWARRGTSIRGSTSPSIAPGSARRWSAKVRRSAPPRSAIA